MLFGIILNLYKGIHKKYDMHLTLNKYTNLFDFSEEQLFINY